MCAVEQYLTVYDKHYEVISARKIGKHKFQASYLDLLDEFFEMAKLCDTESHNKGCGRPFRVT